MNREPFLHTVPLKRPRIDIRTDSINSKPLQQQHQYAMTELHLIIMHQQRMIQEQAETIRKLELIEQENQKKMQELQSMMISIQHKLLDSQTGDYRHLYIS